MAFIKIPNTKIVGMAAAVPKEKAYIKDLEYYTEQEALNVTNLTGIRERRIAPEGMVCSDYCQAAAEQLIEDLDWEKESIDLMIYVSVSRDYNEPNTATVIQGKMGLPITCATMDVPMACSGFCYGLSVIGSYLALGQWKRALMLVGDTQSKLTSPLDKTLWPLLGDAGTATALEYDPNATPMLFNLLNDGKKTTTIYAPASGVREPITEESLKMVEVEEGISRRRTDIIMNGMDVFAFTISQIPKCINQLCEHFEINLEEIDYLLLHQANKYIDEKIRKKLKVPSEKMPYCIEEFGNTSSGTIPMTMITQLAEQLGEGKKKLVMSGFGAGLSWASVYVETDNVRVLPLIEI